MADDQARAWLSILWSSIPRPVFDLCWNETGDSKKILDLIPTRGDVALQYLSYLMSTKRTDAALEVVAAGAGCGGPARSRFIVEVTIRFVEFLERANRVADAVNVWNQLVDRKIVVSGRLDPAAGSFHCGSGFRFSR